MDDEDEFVDAVEQREEEDTVNGEDENDATADDQEGFGDDDFGDFGDFAAEQDDDDDEDEQVHEEYDPDVEEQSRKIQPIATGETQIQPPRDSLKPPLVSPLNLNSRLIVRKL
jgi:hypothetical protein